MAAERSDATSRLPDIVQEFASAAVLALRGGGGRFELLGSVLSRPDDPASVAAARVLGADTLAPCTLTGKAPSAEDLSLVAAAIEAFPPADGGSPVSAWSHWGMRAALHRVRESAGGDGPAQDDRPTEDPPTEWVTAESWQRMTHQLSQLAALAVPGLPSPLATAVAKRPVDLARGFVRAVRRRDWLQAAGAGRWLALTDGVPDSLGLDTGLGFVHHMCPSDGRVTLHLRAAQLARTARDGARGAPG